jgi:hypothetical protein
MATEDEEKKGFSASDILKVLGSLAVGGLGVGLAGRSPSMLGRGVTPSWPVRRPSNAEILAGATLTYPNLTGNGFDYGVVFDERNAAIGQPSENRLLKRSFTDVYPLAQTLDEHNAAVARGDEPDLEAWWPGEDTKPREPLTPSSTAVKSIRIADDNTIRVKFANGNKEYTYLGGDNPLEASEAAKELITASSIGKALLPGRGFWGIRHHNPDYPVYVPGKKKK